MTHAATGPTLGAFPRGWHGHDGHQGRRACVAPVGSALCALGVSPRAAGDRRLRIRLLRAQAGIGLPVRRSDGGAAADHRTLVPARPGARALRRADPVSGGDPAGAPGQWPGKPARGAGDRAVPPDRHDDGSVQDCDGLVELSGAVAAACGRRAAVQRLHVRLSSSASAGIHASRRWRCWQWRSTSTSSPITCGPMRGRSCSLRWPGCSGRPGCTTASAGATGACR